MTAVVEGDAILGEDGILRAALRKVESADGSFSGSYGAKLTVTLDEDEEAPALVNGARITFTTRLYHPGGATNPYGFDTKTYLMTNGIRVGLSGMREPELSGHENTLGGIAYAARRTICERLEAVFGAQSAILEGALIGEKSHVAEETMESFRDSGIVHILTVSGLHMGLLAALFLYLLKPLHLSQKALFRIVAVFLTAYCALTGFSPSSIRAAILALTALFLRRVRRKPDAMSVLAAAFTITILLRPCDLFSAGLQLSYGAVLGILLIGDRLNRPRPERLLMQRILSPLFISVGALAGIALPSILIFHRLSLASLLLSAPVCALMLPLMAGSAAVTLISLVSLPAARFLAEPLKLMVRLIESASDWAAELPLSASLLPSPPGAVCAAIILTLVCLSRYGKLRLRKIGLTAGVCLSLLFLLPSGPNLARYTQFDVGAADAAVIEDGESTCVIDTGAYGGEVADYLISKGRRADILILSHLHADHTLGAGDLLDAGLSIQTVYIPSGAEMAALSDDCRAVLARLREAGAVITELARGDEIRFARTKITALWPVSGFSREGEEANFSSLALLIDLDGAVILQMGDLEAPFSRYAATKADALKCAHHGGYDQAYAEFLARVSPSVAIISASRANEKTLASLTEAGVIPFGTWESGAVTLVSDGMSLTARPYLP